MDTPISIPKQLLAQIDFENTIFGGMAQPVIRAWQTPKGYEMTIESSHVEPEKIKISVADNRFSVFYMIDVLNGERQMPFHLVNLPLTPQVDVNRLKARFEKKCIHISAPFHAWEQGESRNIELEF
jgi:HSP20 family protein